MTTVFVNYHYCLTPAENPFLARNAVSPQRFAEHMAVLSNANRQAEKAETTRFVVTFDDGTRDIFRNAVPLIVRGRIPAILFVCSQPLMQGTLLNVTKNHMLQAKLGLDLFRTSFLESLSRLHGDVEMEEPDPAFLERFYRYDEGAAREFKLLLNVRLPVELVTSVLDGMFEAHFGSQAAAAEQIYMSVDELRQCQQLGIAIGAHTHSHVMLSRLAYAAQVREIQTPIEYFRDQLGAIDEAFSYPYGVEGTWNQDTKRILSEAGIRRAYTLGRREYRPARDLDPLEIPRFDVNDVFDATGSLTRAAAPS